MADNALEVVVRCRNEMPFVRSTLDVLSDAGLRVIVYDNASTDGSREAAIASGLEVVDVAPSGYVPGKVVNAAMRHTKGDVVCFVNADAIPRTADDVKRLASACVGGAAAAYGRQVPRPNATAMTKADYARAFPAGGEGPGFRHFFSMAASAIRRDVWEALCFDEGLRYSEDIDWTWRVRGLGCRIQYVPEARFEHSHDYGRQALWRRMVGEGIADSLVYREGPPRVVRQLAMPLVAQVARDLRSGLVPSGIVDRGVSQAARFRGRYLGWHAPPWGQEAVGLHCGTAYTSDRNPDAERMVEAAVGIAREVIGNGLGHDMEALLLVGGYAGGEGTVEWVDGLPRIHNDLDLVAVVSSARRARSLRARCHVLSKEATLRAKAVVDVYPVPRAELARKSGKLIWLDAAVRGVRLVAGNPRVIEPLAEFATRGVVLEEVGRLLMNRATGVALSRLAFLAGEDSEDVRRTAARHIAKMWLSLGDGLLLTSAQYMRRGEDRHAMLLSLARVGASWVTDVSEGFQNGLQYRKAPMDHEVGPHEFAAACALMWPAFRAVESHRLGCPPWETSREFAADDRYRFPSLVDVSWTGKALSGPRAALQGALSWTQGWKHPRELLSRVAGLLAFGEASASDLGLAARWLATRDASPGTVKLAMERLREVGS